MKLCLYEFHANVTAMEPGVGDRLPKVAGFNRKRMTIVAVGVERALFGVADVMFHRVLILG